MTTPQPIDFERRRAARERRDGDHRTRLDYDTFAELLDDADRVLDDLEAAGADSLLIPADELDFTVRRLRGLIRGAARDARSWRTP